MSVEVLTENNPGPFKIEYDMTPRDNRNGNGPTPTQDSNFRFKGYPEKNFEGSKHPIFGSAPDPTELQGVKLSEIQGSEQRSRKQFFDTRNPKAYGNPKGLQYGSSALPENRTTPQPIRGSLLDMDRSSAEVHKFRQRQEEGAQEIRQLKQERLHTMMNAEAEKKFDMEMLKSYDPWGKPGAGAPITGVNNKKKKFTESDLERVKPSPRVNQDFVDEYGDNNSWWGKPGAGAPLRTDSGKLKTELKSSQEIRFLDTQKGRNVYDVEIRYKQDPQQRYSYSKDLEKQIATKRLENQEDRIRDLKEELAMMQHHPYGKPGAGAPNKSMSGTRAMVGRSTTLSNDWTELHKADQREAERRALMRNSEDGSYDPWGKGVGQPEYDNHGDLKRHPNTRRYEGVFTQGDGQPAPKRQENYTGSLNLSSTRGGGGAPILDSSAEFGRQTRLPILMKRDEKGDATFREDLPGLRRRPPPTSLDDDELRIYDPFGKGGAGAPVRDNRGNVVTTVFGNFNNTSTYRKNSPKEFEKRQARDPNYINELQNDSERFKQQRQTQDRALKFGAGDFATEIERGQVGFPRRDPTTGKAGNHHLASTDVTREKANVYSLKTDKTPQYHTDLKYAEEQRLREDKLEKLRERQEARHHGDSQNMMWGRPGGGAPIAPEHKKANLDQILYSPRRENNANSGDYRRAQSEPHFDGGYKDYQKSSTKEPVDYYAKAYSQTNEARPGNFVRSTIGSNHANMFEYNKEASKRLRGQDYHLPKPFATEGTEVL